MQAVSQRFTKATKASQRTCTLCAPSTFPFAQLCVTAAFLFISFYSVAQSIGPNLPSTRSKSEKYLFYFHGAVVTELGDMAINQGVPEWGPYEFYHILDSLKARGFSVISEIRKKDVDNDVYIKKVVAQVDTLLKAGVSPNNIMLVGASAGWDIVLHASATLKNNSIRYVVMGGCWPETYKDYTSIELYGRFLSIIERTDPHQTCFRIFEGRKRMKSFKEITLNTGLSHGFFYKGWAHWVDRVAEFFSGKK